jgi:hypothetical protein
MSYGTYDNQGPLNQPFNPTANTNIGSDIGRSIGNSIAAGLFGENAQGPLSSVTRELPAMMGRAVYNNLPGAPSPEAQQNVERSRAGGGILKLRQQPPMLGQQPGGKSGGGKSFQPMPSQPVERSQDIPIQEDIPGIITGPGMPGNPAERSQDIPIQEDIPGIITGPGTPSPMPAVQPIQQPGGKSGGGMMPGGKSGTPHIAINHFARGDTGQSALQNAQTNFFRGP